MPPPRRRRRRAGTRSTAPPSRTRHYAASQVDPRRGGTLVSLIDKRTGKQILRRAGSANELLEYREYPNHPLFGEGPWHLTPDGTFGSAEGPRRRHVSPSVADRATSRASSGPVRRAAELEQEIILWEGVDRVDFTTRIARLPGPGRLFRVRFPVAGRGRRRPSPRSATRSWAAPFGFPNVDVGEVPFTLDHPAYDWFGLSATARVALTGRRRAERAATPPGR